MTEKEAITFLDAIKRGLHQTGKDHPYRDDLIPKMKEALCIAIEEMKAESCEDAISRKDAIMCMTGMYIADLELKPDDIISQHIKRIKALPSVAPKRKTGEILTDYAICIGINGFERRVKKTTYCSLCKCDLGYNGDILAHYCPNCGEKLKYKGR